MSLRSPGVVLFYGICHKTFNTCIVMEWFPNGSLHSLMQNPNEVFTWARSFNYCKQMTRALATLHNWKPPIVHRDLKSQNLLVSTSGELKVCDFGLARSLNTTIDEGQSTLVKLRGTFQFTAPEIYSKNAYTFKADIYSLGVVFWELFNRLLKGKYEQPFSEYKNLQFDFQIIIQVAKKDLRPTLPENCPPKVMALIKKCWDPIPDSRPDIEKLIEGIDFLEKEYVDNMSTWDNLIKNKQKKNI